MRLRKRSRNTNLTTENSSRNDHMLTEITTADIRKANSTLSLHVLKCNSMKSTKHAPTFMDQLDKHLDISYRKFRHMISRFAVEATLWQFAFDKVY